MSELVIGRRRSAGRLRTAIAALVVVALIAIVVTVIYRRLVAYAEPEAAVERTPIRYHADRLSTTGGSLEWAGAVPIVHLEGSSAELGHAHGRLLADGVRHALERWRPAIDATSPPGLFHHLRNRWRHRLLDDQIPGHQLVELRALASGAGAAGAYEDLVRAQAALDIGTAPPGTTGRDLRAMARSLSMVVPIRDAQGDRLVVAHTLSVPGAKPPRSTAPVVFTIAPEGAMPFASVGSPGSIGALSGINAEGIAVFVHPSQTADVAVTGRGQPAPLVARDVLERSRTLEQAITLIREAEILGAASFLVVDGKARKHAVIERSPERSAVDHKRRIATGLLEAKAFKEDPVNDRARRARPQDERAARAFELARKADSIESLAGALRDHRSAGGAPLPAGHLGAIDDPLAEQVVIVDTSAMILWVGEGPGSAGPMRAIDLRHQLGLSKARTAPADLAAGDAAATAAIRASATELRRALALAASGRSRAAAEAAARAVSRAPSYPSARRIAGELAEEAGDREAAEQHIRAFLAAPDLPRARDQLRARY